MAVTRLQRRMKRNRIILSKKTKDFKKRMFTPVCKNVDIEEVKKSFKK